MVLLAKTKFNAITFLILKTLIDSNISYDDFFLVHDVLKEYNNMQKQSKIIKVYKMTDII